MEEESTHTHNYLWLSTSMIDGHRRAGSSNVGYLSAISSSLSSYIFILN